MVCTHRLRHLQSVRIVNLEVTLLLLRLFALMVNRARFLQQVPQVAKIVLQVRERRITNVILAVVGVSAVREPLSAILVVQLELTESKEKLLVMAARLANTLLLAAPFVNFA